MPALLTTDITAWVDGLPASDKFTQGAPAVTGTPTLPDTPGWTLHLWPSGSLWKVTGRKGPIGINVDRLSADEVNKFNPHTTRRAR